MEWKDIIQSQTKGINAVDVSRLPALATFPLYDKNLREKKQEGRRDAALAQGFKARTASSRVSLSMEQELAGICEAHFTHPHEHPCQNANDIFIGKETYLIPQMILSNQRHFNPKDQS